VTQRSLPPQDNRTAHYVTQRSLPPQDNRTAHYVTQRSLPPQDNRTAPNFITDSNNSHYNTNMPVEEGYIGMNVIPRVTQICQLMYVCEAIKVVPAWEKNDDRISLLALYL